MTNNAVNQIFQWVLISYNFNAQFWILKANYINLLKKYAIFDYSLGSFKAQKQPPYKVLSLGLFKLKINKEILYFNGC